MGSIDKLIFNMGILEECLQYLWENCLPESSPQLLADFSTSAAHIAASLKQVPVSKDEPKKYYLELAENLVDSVNRLKLLFAAGEREKALVHLRCETYSIFKLLDMEIQFFFVQYKDKESIKAYRSNEIKKLRSAYTSAKKDKENFEFEVSIVILLYNNQALTKECIDSIYKYTKGIKFELITVNNGSDEKTTEWVNSLPHKKKINLKYNIGSSRGGSLSMLTHMSDGRYITFVSNDTVLTPNWLDNLLTCMMSDPTIGLAVPLCNSASNGQAIQVDYVSISEMQRFALNFNHSDKMKWHQRARLFAIVGLFRRSVFEQVGLMNSLEFSYNMFADDDMCMRIKRAGFKMILCRDTFIHHYGSATIKDEQCQVMEKGRQQFFDKYGFDSWYALNDQAQNVVMQYVTTMPCEGVKNILAVDPLYGEECLMLKNYLVEKFGEEDVCIDSISMDPLFSESLRGFFERTFFSSKMKELGVFTAEKKYDIVFLCRDIADYVDFKDFFSVAADFLQPQGSIICFAKNHRSYRTIAELQGMASNNIDPLRRNCYVEIEAINSYVMERGFKVSSCVGFSTMSSEYWEKKLGDFIKLKTEAEKNLYSTDFYGLFLCFDLPAI